MGALVLRLKLVLQLHRLGQGVPEGWSPETDFLTWVDHGRGAEFTTVAEVAQVGRPQRGD